jgi:hypothetical protein
LRGCRDRPGDFDQHRYAHGIVERTIVYCVAFYWGPDADVIVMGAKDHHFMSKHRIAAGK